MKTQFKDILDLRFEKNGFTLATKIHKLGSDAEIIEGVCKDIVKEKGEFGKISASLVAEWMQKLAENVQATLELQIEKDKR